jgi:hypothetical protein
MPDSLYEMARKYPADPPAELRKSIDKDKAEADD